MQVLALGLLLTAALPLARAWRANRGTSLVQAVHWAIAAWLGWVLTVAFANPAEVQDLDPRRYLALGLTGCAGVAVLGARRPHVGAWNFVVLGLLAVTVLPLAENLLTGPQALTPLRTTFLGGVLAVGILNYLPTRFGLAALLLALGVGAEVWLLADPRRATSSDGWSAAGPVLLGLVPWAAWALWRRRPPPRSQFDRLWRDFRDRYGLVWGQRVREQFNRSAAHAGWPARLYWQGLHLKAGTAPPDGETQEAMLETLPALLGRFL